MTSKERVMTALSNQEPDRVPINYSANGGIDSRLKEHFGLEPNDWDGLRNTLGVDFSSVGPHYKGPKLHEDDPERGVTADNWGIRRRWVEHETGGYSDYCDFLLREADEETVANWPMPDPDDHDFSHLPEACKKNEQYAIHVGGAGTACIINTAGFFRSMEQVFCDLALDDPAGLLLIDRFLEIDLELIRRTLEASPKGAIDFMWLGEDLGTQEGPMISMEMLKKHILPRHKPYFDLAAAYDIPTMMHTCGSSSWAYEEYIKLGLKAVDTLQPEAADMSPEYLKKTFGGRLAFHGCISTAGPVATGTVEETVEYCKNTMDIMMPGGGYCFSPTHSLQDNSPTENVVAMYEVAAEYGRY
jgi:uroporphyrinogen decarboxylase